MKIYADMLFAINFSMDFISLFITSVFMRKKIHKKRILLSSVIGGLYGVFEIIITQSLIISVIISVAISFLMCFISFYENNIRRFAAIYVIFWGVSAFLGGFMSLLYTFFNNLLAEYIANYSYTKVYTGVRFFIIAALAIIISTSIIKIFSVEKNIVSAQIEVKVNGKEYSLNGLCDSGNLLTEPISGKSVILVSNQTDLGNEIEKTLDIYKRFIPYTGVNSDGILKGVIPELVKIDGQEKVAVIATIRKKDFAGYEACIPNSLI